jgi:hypothetical protein
MLYIVAIAAAWIVGRGDVMVAKTVHLRLSNLVLPAEAAPVIAAPPKARESRGGGPVGVPHSARHARAAEGEPRRLASVPVRSVERRRWSADLVGSAVAGLVLHGVGGIGKSMLAAEVAARVGRLQPERVTAVISGEVPADTFLAGLAAALRRHPMVAGRGGVPAEAVEAADRIDLPWAQRLALLREHVLGHVPVLVVLDDFDDNLCAESGRWSVRDPALAGLLASWAGEPHLGRLLITCRHPFTPPGAAGPSLGFRYLGPLSRFGAAGLAMSLPALGLLGEPELDRAWRLLGGHPRAMEYLDALLSAGHVGFPDLARRLAGAIQARTGRPVLRKGLDAPTELSPAIAETVAVAACDLLLGELFCGLSADAQSLLIGASVYRAPVGRDVLLLPDGQYSRAAGLAGLVAECQATGLLAADPSHEPPSVFVHRWTACQLHRRLAEAQRGDEVTDAHHRAAEYWRRRIVAWPQDRHAPREASHHLLEAGRLARQDQPEAGRTVRTVRRRVRLLGLAAMAVAVPAFVAAGATGVFSARHFAPSRAGAPASQAAAVRDHAAAWVAQQVSGNVIVACDPAMCSALQGRGIAAGNLLVLRSATSDPLGSDVVMATAAVRSQFGSRLASVYAPGILASFGSGGLRIDVRAVALDGAAAYRTALAADLAARREAGSQLLRNPRISVSAAARSELSNGQVDPRLLATLAALAAAGPVQVMTFGDAGPGASAGMPLRAAELGVSARAGGRAAGLRSMLAFVRAQRVPYLPAQAAIAAGAGGSSVLSIEFAAPSPVGLLPAQPAP